jgi:hypothetical protein
MAKQTGEFKITGTYDDVTYYKMDGEYYARKKSSLTGKKVKRDPRFRRTMQSAHRLARGSQLASKVYRSLPKEKQVYGLFRELKSMAIRTLKDGKGEEEVLKLLQQRLGKYKDRQVYRVAKQKTTPVVKTTPSFTKLLFRGWAEEKKPGSRRRLSLLAEVLRE